MSGRFIGSQLQVCPGSVCSGTEGSRTLYLPVCRPDSQLVRIVSADLDVDSLGGVDVPILVLGRHREVERGACIDSIRSCYHQCGYVIRCEVEVAAGAAHTQCSVSNGEGQRPLCLLVQHIEHNLPIYEGTVRQIGVQALVLDFGPGPTWFGMPTELSGCCGRAVEGYSFTGTGVGPDPDIVWIFRRYGHLNGVDNRDAGVIKGDLEVVQHTGRCINNHCGVRSNP